MNIFTAFDEFLSSQWHGISLFITAIVGVLIAWIKYRHGNLRLSQGRTKRLYEIMRKQKKGEIASSGALQIAVKDMLKVEIPGDQIRFALRRDSPISILRAIKQAGPRVVYEKKDGFFKDARKSPWLNPRQAIMVFQILALGPYFVVAVLTIFQLVSKPALMWAMALVLVSLPIFLFCSFRAIAAKQLIEADSVFPLPHSEKDEKTENDGIKTPKARKRTAADVAGRGNAISVIQKVG